MTTDEPIEVAVCVTPSAKRAEECAVVLASNGIVHRLETTGAGWMLMVATRDAGRASNALVEYDRENRDEPPSDSAPPPYGTTWIGGLIAALLVGFFAVTGPREPNVWFDRGNAAAQPILSGEVWRTVTALTLHADLAHVLSNAIACLVFVTAVAWWLGPGVGTWLVLLAGAGGNALTALVHGSSSISVGASTAIFGALGILAARQFVARRRRSRASGHKGWVVIAASLALLGMLGTGPGSDVLAHVFGLLVGGLLGIGPALAQRRPLGRSSQWLLALAAGALVLACWRIALAAVGPP
jgi:membrane associated rhomboid family serine protease